jgi:hypothetical protein
VKLVGFQYLIGSYKNIYNNHIIDKYGREFDEEGNILYDPTEKK